MPIWSANDQDQLPGRLRRLHPTEGDYAGPVNCIRWLRDILHLKIDSRPLFRHSKAAPATASGRTGPTELAIWKGDRSSNDKYPRSSSGFRLIRRLVSAAGGYRCASAIPETYHERALSAGCSHTEPDPVVTAGEASSWSMKSP
jgi:hypothetical protein